MASRSPRRSAPLVAAWLAAGTLLAGAASLQASTAAVTGRVANSVDTAASGDVVLTNDSAGTAMFTASNMIPGSTVTNCIVVNYTGSLFQLTPVHLYTSQTVNDNNLSSVLNVKIEEGTGAAFGNCATFVPVSTLQTSTPLSTLISTRTNFANGLITYTPTSGARTRSYRFTVTLDPASSFSTTSDNANVTFTWEVQTN